ncbi:K+-transporting ATPase subunit C [Humibacillus sp. DSM 29435]|nr:potassium-transporting ATPase subunit KdpC [Humibacillus sp. DSM 29435]OFE16846.1 K+-transporting ATPase subunit C [Humibacillus sp. DSM 29435]
MTSFIRQSVAGLRALLVLTVVLGLLYPALVWGVGQAVGRSQAAGSLVTVDGAVVGSSLIGQEWKGEKWFHSRPSAGDYTGDVSGGSNLGHGPDLDAAVAERAKQAGIPVQGSPADALTASASGLDPHVTPENAAQQVARVSAARGLPASDVQRLVDEHTQGRTLGFLGEPRVNVLQLNLALQGLTTAATG